MADKYPIRVSLVNDRDYILCARMRLLVLACLGIVTACHCPLSGAPTARAVASDTVRGLVVVAGANPGVVLLRRTGSAELILLQGPADIPLRALESLEIFAAGTIRKGPQGRTLTGVRDFGVVADSGRSARDGRLVKRGNVFEIVDADGVATGVSEPSAELARHVGERVWVSEAAFGVIPELPPETGPVANACSPSRIQKGGGRG
jgi:hypothetical protein